MQRNDCLSQGHERRAYIRYFGPGQTSLIRQELKSWQTTCMTMPSVKVRLVQ